MTAPVQSNARKAAGFVGKQLLRVPGQTGTQFASASHRSAAANNFSIGRRRKKIPDGSGAKQCEEGR